VKQIFVFILVRSSLSGFGQTAGEKEVLALSGQIFQWEVGLKTVSLNTVCYLTHVTEEQPVKNANFNNNESK
jgi:hypothetical protein